MIRCVTIVALMYAFLFQVQQTRDVRAAWDQYILEGVQQKQTNYLPMEPRPPRNAYMDIKKAKPKSYSL